jgi:ribosomal protein S17
MRKRIEEK